MTFRQSCKCPHPWCEKGGVSKTSYLASHIQKCWKKKPAQILHTELVALYDKIDKQDLELADLRIECEKLRNPKKLVYIDLPQYLESFLIGNHVTAAWVTSMGQRKIDAMDKFFETVIEHLPKCFDRCKNGDLEFLGRINDNIFCEGIPKRITRIQLRDNLLRWALANLHTSLVNHHYNIGNEFIRNHCIKSLGWPASKGNEILSERDRTDLDIAIKNYCNVFFRNYYYANQDNVIITGAKFFRKNKAERVKIVKSRLTGLTRVLSKALAKNMSPGTCS